MSPECILFCIDNSEWMRNADYSPNRFHSLYDAVNVILGIKTRDNIESSYGVLSLTGFELLCSFTTDHNKVLNRVHSAKMNGSVDLVKGLRIAELALEQRENKHSDKRIILFVASPSESDLDSLTMLSCNFLQNNVSVDIIMMGEEATEEVAKLENFIEVLNSNYNENKSHILCIPPGESVTGLLRMSEIMPPKLRCKSNVGGFDFDPETDPDLAEAIRLSMKDQMVHQEKTLSHMQSELVHGADDYLDTVEEGIDVGKMTEEQQLEWAIRLSLQPAGSRKKTKLPKKEVEENVEKCEEKKESPQDNNDKSEDNS